MTTHEWICDDCGTDVPFRQPERPQDDYHSEQNGSKECPKCGAEMYFDEVFVPPVATLVAPETEKGEEQ